MTDRIILGTWFQRTSLHVQELYVFFKDRHIEVNLEKQPLLSLHKKMNIRSVQFHAESIFDFIEIYCGEDMSVTVTEDGIILLSYQKTTDIKKAITQLELFYNHLFAPTLSLLFHSGAPLPMSLSSAKEIYPILFTTHKRSPKNWSAFFVNMGDTIQSVCTHRGINIITGARLHVFSSPPGIKFRAPLMDVVHTIVLFREFERQLHRYLRLHREMWDTISYMRDIQKLQYRDFSRMRHQITEYATTLAFVKARLGQMENILTARKNLATPRLQKDLTTFSIDRFDHLTADLKYVTHLWMMTIEYINTTTNLLESLYQENTQRELNALKIITLITALTGFFGMNIAFPWENRWLTTYPSSLMVVAFILGITIGFYYVLRILIFNRHFTIRRKLYHVRKNT